MIDRLIPRSEDRLSAVNYVASVVKDKRTSRVKKLIVVDPRGSMMLQNISKQSLSYG